MEVLPGTSTIQKTQTVFQVIRSGQYKKIAAVFCGLELRVKGLIA